MSTGPVGFGVLCRAVPPVCTKKMEGGGDGTAEGVSLDLPTSSPLCSSGRGGGNAVAGIGKKCGKMREKCGKCSKKCDRKCSFVRMVYAPRNPYVSSQLARLGAQSMDGLMEQLSAVVQLKNITD